MPRNPARMYCYRRSGGLRVQQNHLSILKCLHESEEDVAAEQLAVGFEYV